MEEDFCCGGVADEGERGGGGGGEGEVDDGEGVEHGEEVEGHAERSGEEEGAGEDGADGAKVAAESGAVRMSRSPRRRGGGDEDFAGDRHGSDGEDCGPGTGGVTAGVSGSSAAIPGP